MDKIMTRRKFLRGTASLAALTALGSCSRAIHLVGSPDSLKGKPLPGILLEALKSEDPVIAADGARLLGDLGSRQAVAPLLEYVTRSRRYAKTAGLDALARIGDASACRGIRPLVENPNVWNDHYWYGRQSVQVAAALALLRLGDDFGADALLKSEGERQWALCTWFGPTALRLPDRPAAARRVKAHITFDRVLPAAKGDPAQLIPICDTLGLMRGESARAALVTMTAHASRHVRARAAVNLLAGWRDPALKSRVVQMAHSDPAEFARIKASQALASAGESGFAQAIAEMASSCSDAFDRAAALDSLGVLATRKYAPQAAGQLQSPDPYVRLCAVEALDRMGAGDLAAGVAALSDDPSLRVRLSAAKFLAVYS
jgi:HEAT repeat protein